MTNTLTVGQNVKIIKKKVNGEKEEYETVVSDIESEEIFYLQNPIQKSELVIFLTGSRLSMEYQSETSGLNCVEIEVIDKIKDIVPVLKVRTLTKTINNQRRNFYRLGASLPVKFRKLDDIIIEETSTVDLSAGGMKIKSNQNLQIGDIVLLTFQIGNSIMEVQSKVVNLEKDLKDGYDEVSFEFFDITESERDDIIKFIFEKQREQIKKGI